MFKKQLPHGHMSNVTIALLFLANPLAAQNLSFGSFEGYASSFSNDFIGDGHDRWRSASYQGSLFYGLGQGGLADRLEVRARAEIVSPWTRAKQPNVDRPYVTAIGIGIFGHNQFGGFQTSAGVEVLSIGSETPLADLQAAAHAGLDLENSFELGGENQEVADSEVAFGFSTEIAYQLPLGENAAIRPFVVLSGGAEQVGTVGADILIGDIASQTIWARDVTTGRLTSPHADQAEGISFVAGWDTSRVESSYLIADESSAVLLPERSRARAGIQFNGAMGDIFFGQAWFSEEFEGQVEGQRVGMLSISFVF